MNNPAGQGGGLPASSGGRLSLLDWKAANVRNSWLLAVGTVAVLVALGYLIGQVVDPALSGTITVFALLLALGQTGAAYWFSDRMALSATGARPATREEHRYLVNVTEAVAMGAGVPVPKIYVIDSPEPNAFATGRNPEHGVVAVTTGLMELLDRQELEGVIAHELAHIKNYDMLFGSMLAATVGAIILLRDLFLRSSGRGMWAGGGRRGSSDRNDRSGGNAIMGILLMVLLILAPLLARLLQMAVSRRREFLADASGAYITRNPEGLARALEKLRDYKGKPMPVTDGVRHLFFTQPHVQSRLSALAATHPPIDERIDRLRRM